MLQSTHAKTKEHLGKKVILSFSGCLGKSHARSLLSSKRRWLEEKSVDVRKFVLTPPLLFLDPTQVGTFQIGCWKIAPTEEERRGVRKGEGKSEINLRERIFPPPPPGHYRDGRRTLSL